MIGGEDTFVDVERVGRFLYVAGWLEGLNLYSDECTVIGVMDIYLETWRWIEYPGSVLDEPKLFLYDDGFFALCKSDWSGDETGRVSRFDLSLEEWSYCHVKGLGPGYREGCTGDYLEKRKRFIVFGGKNSQGQEMNDVHVLAMPECRWMEPKVKGRPPGPRYRHSSCVYEGVVYCFGGIIQDTFCWDGMFMLRMEQGDVVSWSSIPSVTGSFHAYSAAMVAFNGRILFCGGEYINLERRIVYDPEEEEFESVAISELDLGKFNTGGSAFLIEEGKSFGVFGGGRDIENYIRGRINRLIKYSWLGRMLVRHVIDQISCRFD